MDELDDYGLTLTHREVELILDALDALAIACAEAFEEGHEPADIGDLRRKITKQTGVK